MNIVRTYRRVESKIGLFGIILFGSEILILLALVWKIPLNNLTLERFERNLQVLAPHHPADSELLLKRKYIGALYPGSSSSCSYIVGEFRASALTRESIRDAYEGATIPSFNKQEAKLPVQVRFVDEGYLDDPWYAWRDELLSSLGISAAGKQAAEKNIYSVYVEQSSYSSPFGDFRCL